MWEERKKILCVEDDHETAGLIAEELVDRGYEVFVARDGREELVKKTGISHHLILKWVDEADLFRVKGIGRQYTELLRSAGVDSVKELAQRRADHLHEKLTAINREKKHVHEVPGVNAIKRWIEEAKALPGIVVY